MNLEKSLRIGIDWLTLYNFEIKFERDYKKNEETTEEYYQERIRVDDHFFSIDTSIRLYDSGKITEFKILRFNPNKLLFGHNIYNSQSLELESAIEKLKELLKEKGISIDFRDAKVREMEININFPISFGELKESFELLLIDGMDLKKISNYEGGDNYREIFKDSTIQAKWNTFSCQAYDKRKEVGNDEILDKPLSRLEWRLGYSVISYCLKEKELVPTLELFMKNFNHVEEIFRDQTLRKLTRPAMKYLDQRIIPNLEKGYLKFKMSARQSRKFGKREERNVYKYLQDNYWIFDYSFLIKLIEKHDSKHKTREINRVLEKYIHHGNLEKFNYLMNFIFPH